MTDDLPGEELARLDLAHLWHPYTQMADYAAEQLIVAEGDGSAIVDVYGNRYLDAISGLWNVQVGHGRQEIADAVAETLRRLAYTPLNGRSHAPAILLAAELARLAPGRLNRVFYATGGAEAVETAIKMARQFWRQQGRPERHVVIGLDRGWHGCTLGALSAGGVKEEMDPYEPLTPGFHKVPPPYCYRCPYEAPSACPVDRGEILEEAIRRIGTDRVGAVMAEPMLGLGGMIVPDAEFWRSVQRICREHDLLLIIDEVATGFGRTGQMFACEHFAIEPDIMTVAKGITSGYLPLAAVLTTDRVHNAFLGTPGRTFSHGYTFGGHPASCAAALANLAILEREHLCERAADLGNRLLSALRHGLQGCAIVGDVRGLGLAIGIEFVADVQTREPLRIAPRLCRALAARGVLTRPVGDGNVLPLLPPLDLPESAVDDLVDAYCAVIHDAGVRAQGHGPPSRV